MDCCSRAKLCPEQVRCAPSKRQRPVLYGLSSSYSEGSCSAGQAGLQPRWSSGLLQVNYQCRGFAQPLDLWHQGWLSTKLPSRTDASAVQTGG